MQLDFEFYKVFIKNQSLYSPIFLQDLILTIPLLDCPMAPSVTCGDSSLPEGAEGNGVGGYRMAGGASPSPTGETFGVGRLRTLPPSGREVPNECEAEGACG